MDIDSGKTKANPNPSEIQLNIISRDDRRVARAVYDGEQLNSIHVLGSGGLLDGVLVFMNDIGYMDFLKRFNIFNYKRMILPLFRFILVYMAKLIIGIPSMNALPQLLFHNTATMELLGFNAELLKGGICNRGVDKRRPGKEPPRPFTPQTLANVMDRFSPEEACLLLDSLVQHLAARSFFDEEVSAIIDATDIEVTDGFKDECGTATRKKTVVDKKGNRHEIEVTVRGYKLITVLCQKYRIPLAAKIVPINESESNYTLELIEHAQRNLGRHARIAKVAIDRGFLDGVTLYELDKKGIIFVVPSKKNMQVTEDARALAMEGEGHFKEISVTVTRGHGKDAHTEELKTELVGIENLLTYDQYNEEGDVVHINRRDYTPKPINAVVVKKWNNHIYPPEKMKVFLTNGPVNPPSVPFHDYDERSLIENLLHREGKQSFNLKNIPKKTMNVLYTHVYIVLVSFALVYGYRVYEAKERDNDAELWPTEEDLKEKEDDPSEKKREEGVKKNQDIFAGIGMARWRRQLASQNKDKVAVVYRRWYGIFDVQELSILAGLKIKDLSPGLGNVEDIFERYGIDPSP